MELTILLSDASVFASLVALMSLGLTLTFMTTQVPNFAQGDFITIGAYTSFILYRFYGVSPYESALVAFVLGGVSGAAIYLLAIRPLTNAGLAFVFLAVATFAISVIFTGLFGIMTESMILRGVLDAGYFTLGIADFTLGGVRAVFIVAPLVLAGLALGLYWLLTRTKLGVAFRASVQNPSLARNLGINVARMQELSWFISGGVTAAAGSILVLQVPGSVMLGPGLLLFIFAASVVGGLDSIFGSLLGGVLIGGLPILVTTELSGVVGYWIISYQDAIPLLVMGIFLLSVPEGIPEVWAKISKRLH